MKVTVAFETGLCQRYAEVDVYKEGCQPNQNDNAFFNLDLSAPTIQELIEKIKEQFDVDDDSIEYDACGEPGRIDIAQTQDDEGKQATLDQLASWRLGKTRLWYVVYTIAVTKVTREEVKILP